MKVRDFEAGDGDLAVTAPVVALDLAPYIAGARARLAAQAAARAVRRERAWAAARSAAALLRERFGATRVTVFGSLLEPDRFAEWSDVDLAVWGVPPERWYRAIYDVMGSGFEIHLVDPDDCKSGLRAVIERTGVELI